MAESSIGWLDLEWPAKLVNHPASWLSASGKVSYPILSARTFACKRGQRLRFGHGPVVVEGAQSGR